MDSDKYRNDRKIYDASDGRIHVMLRVEPIGPGSLSASLTGGEVPHIGAVSVAHVTTGAASGKQDVTSSTITLPGHKEEELARQSARALAASTGRTCVVSCGIHLPDISKEEIVRVQELVEDILDDFRKDAGRYVVGTSGAEDSSS